MNSEQLYEYLTEGRHVSGGQKKLIRNAVNYAAGISGTEERAAFLSAMLKDVYVEDDRPEITAEKLTAFQGRKKTVRVWKTTTRVATQTHVRYVDIDVDKDATEEEILARTKNIRMWNHVSTEAGDKTEEDSYRFEDAEGLIRKEKEETSNTLVLVKDKDTGRTTAKPFGDLRPGDIVFQEPSGEEYIVTKVPSPRKNKRGSLRVSTRGARFARCRGQFSPDNLMQPEPATDP